MNTWLLLLFTFTLAVSIDSTNAAEEELDLDKEATQVKTSAPAPTSKIHIMGRVDLTSETTPKDKGVGTNSGTSSLKNNHFLLFLKVKASDKTSFLGEFVNQSFYHVDYTNSDTLTTSFGKIIVPFGDTRYFHHFYGGIQGYGSNGVMLPNVWAESGFNLAWKLSKGNLDTYVVNSFGLTGSDVDFQSNQTTNQAAGLRWSQNFENKISYILSAYRTDYDGRNTALLGGLDFFTDYGAFGSAILKNYRVSIGFASADIESQSKNYQKRGDYIQVAANQFTPTEVRIRYGTYINDTRTESNKDVHNWNLGLSYPVDVIRILAEYQWNFESVNEYDNDVARLMISLDF